MSRSVWNVIAAREYTSNGQRRSVWTQIGVAFPARDGQGFDCQLHYMPVAQEAGIIRICIRPAMEKQEGNERGPQVDQRRPRTGTQQAPNGGQAPDDGDTVDDIPY